MKQIGAIIHLTNVTKSILTDEVETKILQGITLTVRKGEFIAITGPSGSGKSTLLNVIGLLDAATTGTYILNGKDVTKLTEDEQASIRSQEIGFVFQSFNLLKRISVIENVIVPGIYHGMKNAERTKRAKFLLRQVGLDTHMTKFPNQLSGGQQQRVAIARSLMNNPSIILADEPTGNLDTKSGYDVMQILKKLNKEGNTVILITHEKDVADQANRIVMIRDGRVV